MVKMFYDADCDLNLLKEKTVAIIGYGSQGHAHAQNLKDSGINVIIGVRNPTSNSSEQAKKDGFEIMPIAEAVKKGDLIMLSFPDQDHPLTYEKDIEKNLAPGKVLMFAHGFNIHFNQIVPPNTIDVIMVAPKGPGHTVRSQYVEGRGVPSLIAVYQDKSGKAKQYALAYAAGIGAGRAGILETTFKEETETDLFGEQAVLCGGVSELIKAGFDTLVEAGYKPEIAYFECCHELKLIVDLINQGGLTFMRYSISDTAEYGDYISGKRVINEETRKEMKKILHEIQEGKFATKWIIENNTNRASFNAMRRREALHPMEKIGAELRKMMSWHKKGK